jgi:hypothetical protein
MTDQDAPGFSSQRPPVHSDQAMNSFALLLTIAAAPTQSPWEFDPFAAKPRKSEWIQLFNGRNLEGWSPKIKGYPLGENFGNTFRVKEGVIQVGYEGYGGKFDSRFGHLFYKTPYSNYVFRCDYRFIGEQLPDGPGWAFRNSGAMLHCQDPKTMGKDQDFPVCIEAQFLGGDGKNQRHTGNVCTPGTLMVMNGKLITAHCTDSTSKTYHGDQWVTFEAEVHGSGKIIHRINGETVLEYEQAQLDPGDALARVLIQGDKRLIEGGWIALQSESHPVEFRKVEIKILKG